MSVDEFVNFAQQMKYLMDSVTFHWLIIKYDQIEIMPLITDFLQTKSLTNVRIELPEITADWSYVFEYYCMYIT